MIRRIKRLASLILVAAIFASQGDFNNIGPKQVHADELPIGCEAKAKETNGIRRLAFIVGVGDYKKKGITDLEGPTNDARRIYTLLTDQNGYGFPEENVCVLLDEQATTAQFKKMFRKNLVNRARKNDLAVVYFAGHGSRKIDVNGDEPGRWDSTLMLHDSRTNGIGDLVDDEFNMMLSELYKKTKRVVVITDSCHSGTVTRDGSGYISRYQPPEGDDAKAPPGHDGNNDGWVPESMPEAVVMAAASDDSAALEKGGYGLFTEALWQVMSKVNNANNPLTYSHVARQVPKLIAAKTYQIPYFHGDLARPVFENTDRTRPFGWEVRNVGDTLELSGPPWPGISAGAEFRIYSDAVKGAQTRAPEKSKATVVIVESTGLNATARIISPPDKTGEIVEGDLAVLVRPGDESTKIKVRIRPDSEPGGIKSSRASAIRKQVKENPEASMFVSFVSEGDDFEIIKSSDNRLMLIDANQFQRNRYKSDKDVATSLWQHARQRALRQLRGEAGEDFINDETLQVEIIPSKKQSKCADGIWEQAKPNEEQIIPLCHKWNLKVTVKKDTDTPLLIGAIILSNDGSTFALPRDDRKVLLKGGESYVFKGNRETYIASPPLDIHDQVIVIGTQESNQVSLSQLTSTANARSADIKRRDQVSSLYRALDRYLIPGTRGVLEAEEIVEDTTWTTSTIGMRVEANSRFIKPGKGKTPEEKKREYTIKNFDIRPYLSDSNTSLNRVLLKADHLANASVTDGYGYEQHDWSLPTLEENLKKGIDCSRSMWHVFKTSDLPYNRKNKYLPTVSMVGKQSLMNDNFVSCELNDLRTGDVLVYRDDKKGDGHTVMVIDPIKQIAWGSHGFDGNFRMFKIPPDTGVEYQLIKYKINWMRWDRKNMLVKSCWRHQSFTKGWADGSNKPGLKALAPRKICSKEKQCGIATSL